MIIYFFNFEYVNKMNKWYVLYRENHKQQTSRKNNI